MKTKTLLFLSFLIITQAAFSQKETDWWYFGNRAGVSFTSGSPAAVTNANNLSVPSEGVASISNSKGGLLFYTDGNYVFNKNHQTMSNGTGLNGHNSSTQSAIIVQQPVRGNRYFIFTTDQEWGSKGFQYSIVDTSASGGDGQVVTKNTQLLTQCAEKVSAVKHANKVDTWIVTHSGGDNKFYVYLLTALGIGSPVVSSVGPTWANSGSNDRGYSKGYLKFSPDGTKLVAAVAGQQNVATGQYSGNMGRIEIYDFDNLTGKISNPQIIDKSNIPNGVGTTSGVYGVEFSPDSRLLYVSFYLPGTGSNDGNDDVWQINLRKKTAKDMATSIYVVASGNAWGGMQLGPDGKIYIARPNSTFISSIEKPNCERSACNYVSSAVTLSGRTSQFGIPNFITSYVSKPEFNWGINPANLCEKELMMLYVPDSLGFDSGVWNFDDPATGKLNTATGFKVYHKFSGTGNYNVYLALYRKTANTSCIADTGRKSISVFSYPRPNLGRDTAICQGQEITLNDTSSNATYIWKNNSTLASFIADTIGWNWVDVTIGGCTKRDSMYLDIIPGPKFSLGKDTTFCQSDSVKLTARDGQSFLWSNGKTTASIYVKDSGMVWVKASGMKCSSADTIRLKKAIISPNFSVDNPAQCFKNNVFNFKESSIYSSDKRKQSTWYFYDGSSITDSVAKRTFPNAGTYTIKLISQNKVGCKDSISKTVRVYSQTQLSFIANSSAQCLKGNRFDFYNIIKDTGKISYQWDLGDNTSGNTKDILDKIYLKDSTYKVKLKSITTNNCMDSFVKSIQVFPSPKANFTWGPACNLSNTEFQYTGTKPISSYLWNFNNEGTSTLENSFIHFTTIGTKKVTLHIISDNGCKDTLVKNVEVKKQAIAIFNVNDVCENDSAVFINKSKDATSYTWKFGDGQKSKSTNPKYRYSIGGVSQTFNVTLIAEITDGCSDSIAFPLTVNALPNSDFSFTSSGTEVDFKATQPNNTFYRWHFSDGDSATGPSVRHAFKINPINKVNCLKVGNAAGCVSETCKTLAFGSVYSNHPAGFKIYPNPNIGNFTIEIDNPEKDISVEVYNLVGGRVKMVGMLEKVTAINLDVAAGIYMVKVRNGGVVYYQKVSIQNP